MFALTITHIHTLSLSLSLTHTHTHLQLTITHTDAGPTVPGAEAADVDPGCARTDSSVTASGQPGAGEYTCDCWC